MLNHLITLISIYTQKTFGFQMFSGGVEEDQWYEMGCCFLMIQKQPSRVVLKKKYSENMQQIYRRIPMAKCDFNKVA